MKIQLSELRTNGGTQPRASIDPFVVDDYVSAMNDGVVFPPVVVFYDGTDYWLADGFHRVSATRKLNKFEVEAEVKQGTQRDAILYSVGANASHGLRRTNADKRRAVETLLRDDEWVKWSNVEIAKRCNVSESLVRSLRPIFVLNEDTPRLAMRHGITYSVNPVNIGTKKQEVYDKAPEPIKQQLVDGTIGVNEAHAITRALEAAPEPVKRQVTEMAERGKVPTVTQVKSFIKEGKRQEKETAKSTLPADLLPYDSRYQLYVGDLGIVMAAMQPASVDAIITDPPYPHEFLPVYLKLAKQAKHVLKPGGSLLVMVGQSYLPEILTMMSSEIDYNWTLTYLTPGGQSVQLWDRHVNTFWKPVLWFTNGKYNGDWVGDVLKSDNNDKRFHHWGQSESGMADIIDRFTYPGQTILDPFVGGGTTGVVALKMNRLFIGIDIDSDAIETTRTRIQQRAMESAA